MTALVAFTLYLLLPPALASFALNKPSPNWQYTTASLADTTNMNCITAYSASINCPNALLSLVGATKQNYRPTQQDLSNVCTSTCKNALQDYVTNLGLGCKMQGNIAKEKLNQDGADYRADHVWLVGNILEYTWAQACSKDEQGNFCFLKASYKSNGTSLYFGPQPDCNSECAIEFYSNVHNFAPASLRHFVNATLIKRPPPVLAKWKAANETMAACTQDGNNTNVQRPKQGINHGGPVSVSTSTGSTSILSSSTTTAAPTGTSVMTSQPNIAMSLRANTILWLGLWYTLGNEVLS